MVLNILKNYMLMTMTLLISIVVVSVAFGKFYRQDGYLFRENRICVPKCSMRELLVKKAHSVGLMRHFDVAKTLDVS